MLHWNTVNDLLKNCLVRLMEAPELASFRLVGGTALSLHLGHRISVDLDLFTDAPYESIDFDKIEDFLKASFNHVDGNFGSKPGMGKSYLIGSDPENLVKLDIYYSMDPFIHKPVTVQNIRLANIEDIIAMKLDIFQRAGRKKDFWDLHELLTNRSIKKMLAFHKKRCEWTHDENLIIANLTDFSRADLDPDPICLMGKEWIFIKEDFEAAIGNSKNDK
ncbi:MAG: hypothetical protein DI535_10905 [Citrobacter freundii]|nr:MAG: hypothetical protein DI535_10905 [Citrobacter freundii]